MYNYGRYNKYETAAEKAERFAELRRKANANLAQIAADARSGRAKAPTSTAKTVTEVTPGEIAMGERIIHYRLVTKELNRILSKQKLSREEELTAEEFQAEQDKLWDRIRHLTALETRRYVRIYNKAKKEGKL